MIHLTSSISLSKPKSRETADMARSRSWRRLSVKWSPMKEEMKLLSSWRICSGILPIFPFHPFEGAVELTFLFDGEKPVYILYDYHPARVLRHTADVLKPWQNLY